MLFGSVLIVSRLQKDPSGVRHLGHGLLHSLRRSPDIFALFGGRSVILAELALVSKKGQIQKKLQFLSEFDRLWTNKLA